MRWIDGSSPLGVVTGLITPGLLDTAAKMVLRYTKAAPGSECGVKVILDQVESRIEVHHEYDDARIEEFRV
jgi:hypothetical protein